MGRAGEVRAGRGLYCSRSCASVIKARQVHTLYSQRGSDNHNFKDWASRNKRTYVDRFRAKYPEKARAHDITRAALRSGQLVRPSDCQVCHKPATKPLHSHHEDYSKPLDVVFACRDCHRGLDAKRRELQRVVS